MLINWITKQSLIKHLVNITHSKELLHYIYNYCCIRNIECYNDKNKYWFNIMSMNEDDTNELFFLLFTQF